MTIFLMAINLEKKFENCYFKTQIIVTFQGKTSTQIL